MRGCSVNHLESGIPEPLKPEPLTIVYEGMSLPVLLLSAGLPGQPAYFTADGLDSEAQQAENQGQQHEFSQLPVSTPECAVFGESREIRGVFRIPVCR